MNSENCVNLPVSGGVLSGFGRWEGAPLDWLVLEEKKDLAGVRLLVLARGPVAEMAFGGQWTNQGSDEWYASASWANSDVRAWLNGDFLARAFSPEEQGRLWLTEVAAGERGRNYAPDTRDRVFLLSRQEAEALLPTEESRACGSHWWLRDLLVESPWEDYHLGCVLEDGRFSRGMRGDRKTGVRPALWVCGYNVSRAREELPRRKRALLAERDEVCSRQDRLLSSLSQGEKNSLRKLQAARSDADSEAERARKPLLEAEKAWQEYLAGTEEGIIGDLRRELDGLGLFDFARKKEIRAQLRRREEKRSGLQRRLLKAREDCARVSDGQKAAREALDSFLASHGLQQLESVEAGLAEIARLLKDADEFARQG